MAPSRERNALPVRVRVLGHRCLQHSFSVVRFGYVSSTFPFCASFAGMWCLCSRPTAARTTLSTWPSEQAPHGQEAALLHGLAPCRWRWSPSIEFLEGVARRTLPRKYQEWHDGSRCVELHESRERVFEKGGREGAIKRCRCRKCRLWKQDCTCAAGEVKPTCIIAGRAFDRCALCAAPRVLPVVRGRGGGGTTFPVSDTSLDGQPCVIMCIPCMMRDVCRA